MILIAAAVVLASSSPRVSITVPSLPQLLYLYLPIRLYHDDVKTASFSAGFLFIYLVIFEK